MMIPGVKFKNVKNLISVLTPKFWSWLGFFKNSQNTMGVVYFRKALGKSTSKMMIPGKTSAKNSENVKMSKIL